MRWYYTQLYTPTPIQAEAGLDVPRDFLTTTHYYCSVPCSYEKVMNLLSISYIFNSHALVRPNRDQLYTMKEFL